MKTTAKILSVLLICFAFTSCDEDLLDIDFDTTVKATIDVTVDQGQDPVDDSVVLSLDNNDTHDYLDKIKDVTIKKLTYKIITFYGNEAGTVNVDFYADNIILRLRTGDFNVYTAYSNTTIFEVTDIAKLNTMADLLKNNNRATVGIIGETNSIAGDMDFSIEVTAELEVTANPL